MMHLHVVMSLLIFAFSGPSLASEVASKDVQDGDALTLASYAVLTSGVSQWLKQLAASDEDEGSKHAQLLRFLESVVVAENDAVGPFWVEAHVLAEKGWDQGGFFFATAYAYWDIADHLSLKYGAISTLAQEIRRKLPKISAKLTPLLKEASPWEAQVRSAFLLLESAAFPDLNCSISKVASQKERTCAFVLNQGKARDQLFAQIPKPSINGLPLWYYDDVKKDPEYLLEKVGESEEVGLFKETVMSEGSTLLSFGLRSYIRDYLNAQSAFGNRFFGYLLVSLNNDLIRLGIAKTLNTHSIDRNARPVAKAFQDQAIYLVYENPNGRPKTWGRLGRESVAYVTDKIYSVGLTSWTYPLSLFMCKKLLGWQEAQIHRSFAREVGFEIVQAQLVGLFHMLIGRRFMEPLQEFIAPSPTKDEKTTSSGPALFVE